MKPTLKVHAAASVFPPLGRDEFERLKADIEKHGQQDPVVLWHDGTILDGRNRYNACCALDVECECEEFDADTETDPFDYAISKNIHRRHLTTSQRSTVAAKIATLQVGSNQHVKEGGYKCPPSIGDASKLLNVSPKSVKNAKHVIAAGSKALAEAVETDDIPVSLAAKLVDEVPDKAEQTRLVKAGAKAIREYITPGNDHAEPDEPEQVCDRLGNPVEGYLADVFADVSGFDLAIREINAVGRWLTDVIATDQGAYIARDKQGILASLRQLKQAVKCGKPYAVCVQCEGVKEIAGVQCDWCMGAGWQTEMDNDRATRAMAD